MYIEYGSKVEWWCTINEPEVCTANSYVTGLFPPGKFAALRLAGKVLKVYSHNCAYSHMYMMCPLLRNVSMYAYVYALTVMQPAVLCYKWHCCYY
jgi:beta-glucosidase/6-phospho-beta-glucosidase/beta-galactosidase